MPELQQDGPTFGARVVFDSALDRIAPMTSSGKTRILVVDDKVRTLRDIAAALKDETREVIAVSEPGEAAQLLRQGGVDVLVADFHCRKKNDEGPLGDDLCELAKSVNPKTVTILMSGDPGDARKRAVDHIIQKVYEPIELTALLVKDKVSRVLKEKT
jgi:CheY-like chemotaxis protein